MKTIVHTDTLVYYDGAQVFEGHDSMGACYIGVMIDSLDSGDRYIVTKVSPEPMRKFRAGAIDLRTLLVEEARDAWYMTQTEDDFARPLALEAQSGALEDTDFLPEKGFILCQPSPSLP